MKILYNSIDGSAPLSINWFSGPMGNAVEDENEIGVGFFSPTNDLLGVIFDDVEFESDRQELVFANGASVLVEVNHGVAKVIRVVEAVKQEAV